MTKTQVYDYLMDDDNVKSKEELIHYLSDCFGSERLTELVNHIKAELDENEDSELIDDNSDDNTYRLIM